METVCRFVKMLFKDFDTFISIICSWSIRSGYTEYACTCTDRKPRHREYRHYMSIFHNSCIERNACDIVNLIEFLSWYFDLCWEKNNCRTNSIQKRCINLWWEGSLYFIFCDHLMLFCISESASCNSAHGITSGSPPATAAGPGLSRPHPPAHRLVDCYQHSYSYRTPVLATEMQNWSSSQAKIILWYAVN